MNGKKFVDRIGMGKGRFLIIYLLIAFFHVNALIANAKVPDVVLNQKNAVVTIYIYEKDKLMAYGSGFIIDPDGIVATNYHVIAFLFKNPDTAIAIKMENGDFIKALKLLSFDESKDVALIQTEGKKLPSLNLTQGTKPKQGDEVFVIGSPYGFETTISNGIISSIRGTDEFLQITAPVSGGSSGSPVFSSNGEVAGIATLVMQGGQNLNFAVPIKYITEIKKSVQTIKIEPLKATIPAPVIKPKAENKAKSYDEILMLAKEHYKNYRWTEAIEEYTKAISIKPENAYLYFARAKTIVNLVLFVPAPAPMPAPALDLPLIKEEDIKPIQDSNAPDDLQAASIERKKNNEIYNTAIEDHGKAIALQPDNVVFYYARAEAYSSKGEHENAIKDFDKAISLKPDISFLYKERGSAFYESAAYMNAIKDYTKAINLKPDKQQYFLLNVSPFKEVGFTQEELNEMVKYFDASGHLSSFYSARASSYENKQQIKEAIKDYEKSITISSFSFFSPCLALNTLYEKEGRLKDGVKFYSHIITLRPKETHLYTYRANFYDKLKQYDKALKDYTRAIELNPKGASYYLMRGSLYDQLKQYDKAINDYTKAIELEPINGWYYYSRGELYIKANTKLKALVDFKKACDSLGNEWICERWTEIKKEIKRGDKWVYYSSGGTLSCYYDKTSIKQQASKHKRVWVRYEVIDVSAYVQKLKDRGLPITAYKTYEDLSHSLSLEEFNCNTQQSGTVSIIYYNNNNNVIDSYNPKSIEMEPIVPDSIGDALYKIVCEGKGKMTEKKRG